MGLFLFYFNKNWVMDYVTDIMNFMSKDKIHKKTSFP